MQKANRKLVLDSEHERTIHMLCHVADLAVWRMRENGINDLNGMADKLEAAWKKVSHEVMP